MGSEQAETIWGDVCFCLFSFWLCPRQRISEPFPSGFPTCYRPEAPPAATYSIQKLGSPILVIVVSNFSARERLEYPLILWSIHKLFLEFGCRNRDPPRSPASEYHKYNLDGPSWCDWSSCLSYSLLWTSQTGVGVTEWRKNIDIRAVRPTLFHLSPRLVSPTFQMTPL